MKRQQTNGSPAATAEGQGETIAGFFRKYFAANPKQLKVRSNDAPLQAWREAHPGEEVTDSVKNSLANIKSVLRNKARKRRHKPAAEEAPTVAVATPAPAEAEQPTTDFETLEIAIDDCMTLAKDLDRDRLEGVISLLRRARREVVWLMGE
jgi:hypothetical protein